MNKNRSEAQEQVYTIILEHILNGDYAPGSDLNDSKLSQQLGADLLAVQEVLRRLAREEIIEADEHLTYSIKEFSLSELTQILEMRECLEPYAASLAADRITPEGAARLREILQVQKQLTSAGAPHSQTTVDHDLHIAIAELTGNNLLAATMREYLMKQERSICSLIFQLEARKREDRERIEQSFDTIYRHEQIVEAISTGNAGEAAHYAYSHALASKKGWLKRIHKEE
jgi:DNA-binding GntR family transcriptional regulator